MISDAPALLMPKRPLLVMNVPVYSSDTHLLEDVMHLHAQYSHR